ncbi:MAG: hypothetical protein O2800_05270 [Planctomycetota bacterium]|nr:hypothetical protein [Planctomycetota bacterium]
MNESTPIPLDLLRLRDEVERTRSFRELISDEFGLRCQAQGVDAWYEITEGKSAWVVRLILTDRWLSESIESALVHSRDTVESLIDDELIDLGCSFRTRTVRHFRDLKRQYIFEADIPAPESMSDDDTTLALQYLLAFESAFRHLGNMSGDSEE